MKSHQEQSDAILNDIKKRLASCSVDEVKELTDLMMKVMENQRRTSESMSKWNRGGTAPSVNSQEIMVKDTERFDQKYVDAVLDFSNAEITYEEVN